MGNADRSGQSSASNAKALGREEEQMKKKDQTKTQRNKKVKVDLDSLPLAVMDGKLIVRLKGRVYFERTLQNKTEIHSGEVFSYDAEAGWVSVWDDTRENFFGFDLKDTEKFKIRAASEKDLTEPLDIIKLRKDVAQAELGVAILKERLDALLFLPIRDPGPSPKSLKAAADAASTPAVEDDSPLVETEEEKKEEA